MKDVPNLNYKELKAVLGKQIMLQRGHWQEYGIQNAIMATGVKLIPQLEISIECNGVPIEAHLGKIGGQSKIKSSRKFGINETISKNELRR
jgi:hypothetical protein